MPLASLTKCAAISGEISQSNPRFHPEIIFILRRTMKAMADHTKMGPPARIQKLLLFNKRIEDAQRTAPTLREWNLELDPNLVTVKGRILPYENIVYAGDKK